MIDGRIVAAAQEERFTRKKHDDGFPTRAIEYCLAEAGLTPSDVYDGKRCWSALRESAGLPVLAAYQDTDVPDDADYFHRLPNDAASLAPHRDAIAAWLERWQGRRVPRAAVAHLDTEQKEKRRLAFLTRIAARSPS